MIRQMCFKEIPKALFCSDLYNIISSTTCFNRTLNHSSRTPFNFSSSFSSNLLFVSFFLLFVFALRLFSYSAFPLRYLFDTTILRILIACRTTQHYQHHLHLIHSHIQFYLRTIIKNYTLHLFFLFCI